MARTLLVEHWTFHTARVREVNRQDFQPSDLSGIDLLDYVREELSERPPLDLEKRQRWVRVDSVQDSGTRSLLVTATAGKYGEAGEVVNRTSGEVDFELKPDHAPTTATRTLIVAPETGLHAFAFYERSTGRGTSGMDLVQNLRTSWRDGGRKITWAYEWLQNGEVWITDGSLKAVQIRRYGHRGTDVAIADGPENFVYTGKARRGHVLPRTTLDRVLSDPKTASSIVGVQYEDGDRAYLEMVLEGSQKIFAVEGGQLPKLQEALPDGLNDREFVKTCSKIGIEQLAEPLGFQWLKEWADGTYL